MEIADDEGPKHPLSSCWLVRPAGPADGKWISGFLRQRWNATTVVVHGEIIDAVEIPALIVEHHRALAIYRAVATPTLAGNHQRQTVGAADLPWARFRFDPSCGALSMPPASSNRRFRRLESPGFLSTMSLTCVAFLIPLQRTLRDCSRRGADAAASGCATLSGRPLARRRAFSRDGTGSNNGAIACLYSSCSCSRW